MNHLSTWLSGIGILIFVYLILSQGDKTTSIIDSIASGGNNIIKTLQGR